MSGGAAIRRAKRKRDPLERWFTPVEVARRHIQWTERHAVLHTMADPCAGAGAYLDAAAQVALHAVGADVAPERDDIERRDALVGPILPAQACVTNPPFSRLSLLLPRMRAAYEVVSLLLPKSATEATKERAPIWLEDPPDRIHEIGRVRFGGPALTYGLEEGEEPPKAGAQQSYLLVLWLRSRPLPHRTVYTWRRPDHLSALPRCP